jgi:glucosamine--fructose-6-phosphate aminotransferase (isomerizing)
MDLGREMRDAPRALRETIEKGRPQYEALVRRMRWGEGPVYLVGSGPSFFLALAGVYAWEGLLGWPVVARSAGNFETYSASVLRPRSVLVAISASGEDDEALEAARAARARGARILVLTENTNGPLAAMADGIFPVESGGPSSAPLRSALCEHAALGYIGLTATRVLKRHHPRLDTLEAEFQKLPDQLDWMLTQLSRAVSSFAGHLEGVSQVWLVGAGSYHPAGLLAAHFLGALGGIQAIGFEAMEFLHGPADMLKAGAAVVAVSGSRCHMKNTIYRIVERAKKARAIVLSVSDPNDRQLIDESTLAVLLPPMTEITGSTLALGLLQWVAAEIRQAPRKNSRSGKRPMHT